MLRLSKFYQKYSRRAAWGFLLLLFTNLTTMAIPLLFRYAVDGVVEKAPKEELYLIAWTLVVVALGAAGFRIIIRIHLFYVARDIELDIRTDFYNKLSQQSPSYFLTHTAGDLMSRATNDLTQIRLLLGHGVLNIVNTAIAYAVAIPLMFMMSVKLSLMALVIYPPALIAMQYLGHQLHKRNLHQQEILGEVSGFVRESLSGAHVIRAFGRETRWMEYFQGFNQKYYKAAIRLVWARAFLFRFVVIIANLALFIAVFVGTFDVMDGTLSLGELVALLEYLALLAWPTFALGWVIALSQRGRASMKRIAEILDAEPSIVSGNKGQEIKDATLEVQDLRVEVEDKVILDGVSLKVEAGTTLGIVGTLGSGKSILFAALQRAIEVEAGTIEIGGVDIETLPLAQARSTMAYVSQTPMLFSSTLRENVAFGRPDATDEEILAALKAAAFERDLEILPQGLDTPVGERGLTLSGGQKQRVCIARALLVSPQILLLDDALASVDSQTETQIIKNLKSLREGRTNLIISHRISAVSGADEIIVMTDGKITERGTDSELRENNGIYAAMAKRQEVEANLALSNQASQNLKTELVPS